MTEILSKLCSPYIISSKILAIWLYIYINERGRDRKRERKRERSKGVGGWRQSGNVKASSMLFFKSGVSHDFHRECVLDIRERPCQSKIYEDCLVMNKLKTKKRFYYIRYYCCCRAIHAALYDTKFDTWHFNLFVCNNLV